MDTLSWWAGLVLYVGSTWLAVGLVISLVVGRAIARGSWPTDDDGWDGH